MRLRPEWCWIDWAMLGLLIVAFVVVVQAGGA